MSGKIRITAVLIDISEDFLFIFLLGVKKAGNDLSRLSCSVDKDGIKSAALSSSPP